MQMLNRDDYYKTLLARRDDAKKNAHAKLDNDGAMPRFAPTGSWQALYQQVLSELGDPLLHTSRSGEARRALDDVYDNVLEECLASGSWNFATETIKATADTGVTPNFGFTEVFAKPTDWVRTVAVSGDEYFSFPLLQYYDDVNFWSADFSPIYVRYVSDDTGMGLERSRWPMTFRRYVELELAVRVCLRLTQNAVLLEELKAKRDEARRRALNNDAMNEPQPKFPPSGSWTLARGGRTGRDRGSRSSLTG